MTIILRLAIATAVAAYTLTRSHAFEWWRNQFKPGTWFGALVRCPYCASHWIAFGLTASIFDWSEYTLSWYFIQSLVVVGLAVPILWMIHHALASMTPQPPEVRLEEALKEIEDAENRREATDQVPAPGPDQN